MELMARSIVSNVNIVEAASIGDAHTVNLLLDQGVSTETKDEYGRTALRVATGHLGTLQLLLNRGANVNAIDHIGQTSIFGAVKSSNYIAAEVLLGYGADVHIHDRSDKLPIDYAWEKADYTMVDVLYRAEPDPDIVLAALVGDAVKVREMHKQGSDVNIRNAFGETALTAAISRGHREVAKYLIDIGADVNLLGRYCSPLVSAIQRKDVSLVKSLLNHSADINGVTDYGSPLMAAVTTGDSNLVNILLQHTADASLVDSEGYTALSLAKCDERQDIVDLLLAYDARHSQ